MIFKSLSARILRRYIVTHFEISIIITAIEYYTYGPGIITVIKKSPSDEQNEKRKSARKSLIKVVGVA